MTAIKPEVGKPQPQTEWRAIYIATFMLLLCGLNISIYYMSMWPYVKMIAPDTEVSRLGWIVGANSFGCLVANPLFGWWAQKSMKTAHPVAFGFALATIGNFMYGILPLLPESWIMPTMMVSRFLSGFGSGTLGVLRSFVATSSTSADRLKAIAYASTGVTLGLSIGPVIQLFFMPLGPSFYSFIGLPINQYTSPGFAMTIVCALCVVLLMTIFVENHVGIISDDEKKSNPYLVLPKFDRLPVVICFFVWSLLPSVGAAIYIVAPPLTMSMYNWSSEEAVTKNAVLQIGSSVTSVITNLLLGKTRLGKIDRRIQILFGLGFFAFYQIANYPWFFYDGPLDYVTDNSSSVGGGCPREIEWCSSYTRVPIYLYYFCFVFALGVAFPMTVCPMNALFSQIVGPRKQSFLQGMMTFTGSVSQFITPLITMFLYEIDGYRYVAVCLFISQITGILLILIYYKRMVPLQQEPPLGVPTKYKKGTFYKM